MMKSSIEGLDDLVSSSKALAPAIKRGKREFLSRHVVIEVNLQGNLVRNLMRLVYNNSDPDTYKRTMSLLNSIRLEHRANSVSVYMDGDYLRQASNTPTFWETGQAPNSKGVNYAFHVEEGHYYNNVAGAGKFSDRAVNVTTEPRPFMEATWQQVLSKINPNRIADRAVRMWSR